MTVNSIQDIVAMVHSDQQMNEKQIAQIQQEINQVLDNPMLTVEEKTEKTVSLFNQIDAIGGRMQEDSDILSNANSNPNNFQEVLSFAENHGLQV